ncbi:prepilin peptidase [Candidatus Woesearchaeota archaeon]|nr:prepilin peptidase [Candidatus Woesearchaeota archaeon]
MISILLGLAVAAVAIGCWTDFTSREVPDWLNYSFIAAGLGIRLLYSIAVLDWRIIAEGLAGAGAAFLLALFFFYTGQWGGGDSKMLIGLGAAIGFWPSVNHDAVSFLVYTFAFGSVYGLVWTAGLAVKHRAAFARELHTLIGTPRMIRCRRIIHLSALALIIFAIILQNNIARLGLLAILLSGILLFYGWIFTKVVEKACLIRRVDPSLLTVGDWVAEEIIIGKKLICSPKDLGLDQHQLDQLVALKKQNKIGNVLAKYGIPFVPSFLLGLVGMVVIGSPLGLLV